MFESFDFAVLAQTNVLEAIGLVIGGIAAGFGGKAGYSALKKPSKTVCPLHAPLVESIAEIKKDTRMIVRHLLGDKIADE